MPFFGHNKTQTHQQASETGTEMPSAFDGADARVAKLAAAVRNRPIVFAFVRFIKKTRTKFAFLLVAWCLVEGVRFHERPFSLVQPNLWVIVGLLLILGGLAFRLAALGCIRKKECLATQGVYSLCRHPLYLGSIFLAFGFCILTADVENVVLATVYFAIFYPLTIFWEEIRLGVLYGESHSQYRDNTPALLPLGVFRAGVFRWRAALSQGGCLLLVTVLVLLVGVQVMAVAMSP